MRTFLTSLLLLGVAAVFFTGASAGEKKEEKKEVTVTLKGTICCAKCELAVETKCMTVIVAKKEKKDVTYYFDPKGDKKYHEEICTAAKKGTVTGTVKTEGKKKTITVKTLKFD